MIVQNFHTILAKVKEKNASLIAVSKNKSCEDILTLYNLGQRDFGENYVQELLQKQAKLPQDIRWHFIGHLQRNKVKNIIPFIYCIQSIDSEKLWLEIEKEAKKNNRKIQVFLQLFIAQESTKYGLSYEEAESLLKQNNKSCAQISGLMGMATLTDNLKKINQEFESLQQFFLTQKAKNPNLKFLSMGMSSDYEMALNHGSNMVRIGSAVFGARTAKTP